jgi:separase
VDPEGNLSETKKRLVPAIENICDKHGWNWGAVIGTLPSEDFVQNALSQRNGLLLYCGHGGATACFSRSHIEGLMKGKNGGGAKRRCRSTIILMGCSSGKLVSVNRKESKTTDKVTMFYEPEGIALSYLCAGAPCVVGNLWDVTDRDIDRYNSFFLSSCKFVASTLPAQSFFIQVLYYSSRHVSWRQ